MTQAFPELASVKTNRIVVQHPLPTHKVQLPGPFVTVRILTGQGALPMLQIVQKVTFIGTGFGLIFAFAMADAIFEDSRIGLVVFVLNGTLAVVQIV